MADKRRAALEKIVSVFESGDVPKAIAIATFPCADVPMGKWSLGNRVLCVLQGTEDARGYRQWQEVGRQVIKGSKAIHILRPKMVTRPERDAVTGEESKRQIIIGFATVPVFRIEDTEGEALAYKSIELPSLPLMDVAERWGLNVKAIPGNSSCYGYYSPKRGEIGLATSEEKTFLHELCHAAHDRILKAGGSGLKGGQVASQEIIADLSACALGYMIGKDLPRTIGNTWEYVSAYSKAKDPVKSCLRLLGDCEKVLAEILGATKGEYSKAA